MLELLVLGVCLRGRQMWGRVGLLDRGPGLVLPFGGSEGSRADHHPDPSENPDQVDLLMTLVVPGERRIQHAQCDE